MTTNEPTPAAAPPDAAAGQGARTVPSDVELAGEVDARSQRPALAAPDGSPSPKPKQGWLVPFVVTAVVLGVVILLSGVGILGKW